MHGLGRVGNGCPIATVWRPYGDSVVPVANGHGMTTAIADPAGFELCGLLRRARRRADLSQRDLAARAGVSPSTVARAESVDGAVSFRMVLRLFAAAGMRLVVQDCDGVRLTPMRADGIRDSVGRRYAAHLDPEPMRRNGRFYPPVSRGRRPDPVAAQERRPARDERRDREGTPFDHPGPEDLVPPRPPLRKRIRIVLPECTCDIDCERECVPECACQCEPWRPSLGPRHVPGYRGHAPPR